jgi:hypothetical protein
MGEDVLHCRPTPDSLGNEIEWVEAPLRAACRENVSVSLRGETGTPNRQCVNSFNLV